MNRLTLALPALERSIGAGTSQQQLVISLYALGLALSLTPAGRIADAWSRRGMLVIGMSVFAACSIAAGLAPTPEVLIATRLVQGIAAGLILPQTTGVFQDLYRGPALARAYGGWGATVGTVSLLGPPLTGFLLGAFGDEWGWRVALLLNVPIVLVALFAVAWTVPPNGAKPRLTSLDPVGLLLLAIVVSGLLLPLTLEPAPGAQLLVTATCLGGAVVACLLLLYWERRFEASGNTPFISVSLLRNIRFRNGSLIGMLFFLVVPGTHIGLGLYLQQIVGLSALETALLLIGAAVASTLTAWFGSKYSYRFGRGVVILGLATIALGAAATACVCLLIASDHELIWWIIPTQMLLGAGSGLVTAPNQSVSMMTVPRELGSLASSLFQLGQRVGTALGAAIAIALTYLGMQSESGSEQWAAILPLGFTFIGILLVLLIAIWDARTSGETAPPGNGLGPK